jgi:hypothetical protein
LHHPVDILFKVQAIKYVLYCKERQNQEKECERFGDGTKKEQRVCNYARLSSLTEHSMRTKYKKKRGGKRRKTDRAGG